MKHLLENKDKLDFSAESEEVFTVNADKSGYYLFAFEYELLYGDGWHELTVTDRKGSSILYRIGFSFSRREASAYIYLFEGENNIKISGVYGDMTFYSISLSEEPVRPPYSLSPTHEIYCLNSPRHLKIHVLCYDSAPEEIRCEGVTLPCSKGSRCGGVTIPCSKESRCDGESVPYAEDACICGAKIPFTAQIPRAEGLLQGDALVRTELILSPKTLSLLPPGTHLLDVRLDNGVELPYTLKVEREDKKAPLEILNFNVHHGNATLISLPNGKHLMIDSGKQECARNIILPYLTRNEIHVDYYLLTHFHEDHDGMLEYILKQNGLRTPDISVTERSLKEAAENRYPYLSQFEYLDSRMIRPFDRLDKIWDLGGVEITVLNSRLDEHGNAAADLSDENNSSVSFALIYKGFRYHHAADNYANTEERILRLWEDCGKKDFLKCDYFYANHHFHGSVGDGFIRYINPEAVFVSAQAAVYARGAYTTVYREGVQYGDYPDKRLKDTLLSCEVGSVKIKVYEDGDWHYESIDDLAEVSN